MEGEQFDQINDEFRRAGNYGRRKGEDLVPKEEPKNKILSPKENAKRVRELLKHLENREKDNENL